ncbi:MAG: D-alanyl-D-alanine carboxypeptidase [Lachnospiraceae bacterium]|nr:D-alanyl-D-alanine carboxypeptidase [Lachnospiraceae bacterium]
MENNNNKDFFTDRQGRVHPHSESYYQRKRQVRMQLFLLAAGVAALIALIIGIVRLLHRGTQTEVQAKELEPAAGAAVALEKLPEATPQEEVPEEEEEETTEAIGSHPDLFYEGYEVYQDSATKSIWNEEVVSSYGVLIDLKDGHIVAQRNAEERMYPASMTKVMTILTAADYVTDPEDTFVMTQEITDYVFRHECSQVGYSVGEEMTVRELFFGTILPSGGDAAMALAYYTAGSVEAFAELMNKKAEELGIADVAHFTNPIGIHDPENYCTPISMAMIMKAALENDLCREALGAHIYTTAATEYHPDGIQISNWFLRRIEDKDTHGVVLGAKTGFVNESGCCAVSYEQSDDGNEYICVTGKANTSWRAIYDHVAIYDDFVN